MIRTLLALAFVFAGISASAEPTYLATTGGYASAAAQSVAAFVFANGDQFFVTSIKPTEIARKLDEGVAQDITKALKDSPLKRFGLGNVGGAKISIKLDETFLKAAQKIESVGQLAEKAGLTEDAVKSAKLNEMQRLISTNEYTGAITARDIKVIKYASDTELETALKELGKTGVPIESVEFSGFLRTVANGTVTITRRVLTGVFAAGALSNAVRATEFALSGPQTPKTWVAQSTVEQSSFKSALTWLFDTTDALYFKVYAEPSK